MKDRAPQSSDTDLLRDSEERYRKLIDASPDAIFMHSDWRIILVNQAMLRLFRAERAEQLLGREVLDLIAPESRDIVRERIARLYEDRLPAAPAELEYLRVDGGAAANDLLMQFQADILGVPVVRPKVLETTALGAAYLAGLYTGVWSSQEEIAAQWRMDRRFEPTMARAEAGALLARWREAVSRSLRWSSDKP